MKLLRKLKERRQLQTSLIFDFFFFFLILAQVIAGAIITSSMDVDQRKNENRIVDPNLKLDANYYVSHLEDQVEIDRLFKSKGWLEELDKDRRVLRVQGEKQDMVYQYTEEELLRNLENLRDQEFYTSITTQPSNTIGTYYTVLKIPRNFVRITTNDELLKPSFHVPVYMYTMIWTTLMMVVIFIYSYWVARRLKKPLKQISQGLNRMTKGNYDTRLSLVAEKEFVQIRDTFNYMADVIEQTLEEKRHAEESKQRLIVDLSHDLKTPITSIQGYAQALYEGIVQDSERHMKYLGYIYHKANEVNKLIYNMMELMKLDSPDYPIRLDRNDVSAFLREIVAELYGDIEHKKFKLQLFIPDVPIYAVYDPELLASAVRNLISNSIAYNPIGTAMRIELKSTTSRVVIEIADKGIGIPKHLRSSIFEPFVRGDEARAGDGGTGLGLSIALKNTVKMGGTLELHESSDEVTIFSISLHKELL